MPTTEAGPLLEAAPTPNLFRPPADAEFYARASVLLGASVHALRRAVTEGVLSIFRVNAEPVLTWTREDLIGLGVIDLEKPAPPEKAERRVAACGSIPGMIAARGLPVAVPGPDDMLTALDLCRWLRVSRRTIYKWYSEGTIPPPARPTKRVLRWRRRDIEAAIASRSVGYTVAEVVAPPPVGPTPPPPPATSPPWRGGAGQGGEPVYSPLDDEPGHDADDLDYATLDQLLGEAKGIADEVRAARAERKKPGPAKVAGEPAVDAEVNRPRRRCYDPVRATPPAPRANNECSSGTP